MTSFLTFDWFRSSCILLIITIVWLSTVHSFSASNRNSDIINNSTKQSDSFLASNENLKHEDKYLWAVGIKFVPNHKKNYFKLPVGTFCMGSLLTKTHVLTAARCSANRTLRNAFVFLKNCAVFTIANDNMENQNNVRKSSGFIIHEHYRNEYDQAHNIMIVILSKPFDEVQKYPILFGCPEMFAGHNKRSSPGLKLKSLGCGQMERIKQNKTLNGQVNDKSIPRKIQIFGLYGENIGCSVSSQRWKFEICNKPNRKMICEGDYGSPLIFINEKGNDTLIGFATFIYNHSPNCDEPLCGCRNMQGSHLFLYKMRHWIVQKTKVTFKDCSTNVTKIKHKPSQIRKFHTLHNSQATHLDPIKLHLLVILFYELSIFLTGRHRFIQI